MSDEFLVLNLPALNSTPESSERVKAELPVLKLRQTGFGFETNLKSLLR